MSAPKSHVSDPLYRATHDERTWAATMLACNLKTCQALLHGERVPLQNLHAAWLARLRAWGKLEEPFALDDAMVRRMVLLGSIEPGGEVKTDKNPDAGRAEAVPFSQIALERVHWLVPDRVPYGAVTLLAGDPGVGKSLYTIALAADVSRGDGPVLFLTAEDSLSWTVKPRLLGANANVERVKTVRLRRHGIQEGLAIPDDVRELSRLVEEHNARLVVIDPLMAHLPKAVNSWRDQSVRRALAPLHHLAEKHGCAIVVVLHLNKARGGDALARIGGSMGIPAAARSALLLARDPDDPEWERGRRRVLAHVKSNIGPIAMSLLYEVEPILVPATDGGPDIRTAKLEFVAESEHKGHDLLNLAGVDERSAIEDAMDFLRDELADGEWHSSNATKTAGKRAGHSPSTLRRGRERLGVETERHGFPAKTMWRLAADLELAASRAQGARHDCKTGAREHDYANRHEQRDPAAFEAPPTPSRAHLQEMSTTGTSSTPGTDADLGDGCSYPGGEAALLADLIETFDGELIDEERAA